mmetsp:Transcript_3619/g.7939  ORF Transcript_3619/g.7939 Transcript_3619/m.7939 type:complete len:229 (+) Transcript_3619:798-1484(+)
MKPGAMRPAPSSSLSFLTRPLPDLRPAPAAPASSSSSIRRPPAAVRSSCCWRRSLRSSDSTLMLSLTANSAASMSSESRSAVTSELYILAMTWSKFLSALSWRIDGQAVRHDGHSFFPSRRLCLMHSAQNRCMHSTMVRASEIIPMQIGHITSLLMTFFGIRIVALGTASRTGRLTSHTVNPLLISSGDSNTFALSFPVFAFLRALPSSFAGSEAGLEQNPACRTLPH